MPNASANWTPPDDPDPHAILYQAHDDARDGRHEDALKRYEWFHRNALKYDEALSAVRLSFAVGGWRRLAEVYPPAMVKLIAARDEARHAVSERKDVWQSFADLAAINRELGEPQQTVDAFKELVDADPTTAKTVFRTAKPALIRTQESRLCGKYVSAGSFDSAVMMWHENIERAREPEFGTHFREYAEQSFKDEVTMLVALLAVNDRKAEAEQVAAKAKAEWDDPDFHAAIDKALTGKVPDPWP